jgi:hypothetical protein
MHAITEELEYLSIHVVTDDGIDTPIVGVDVLIDVKLKFLRLPNVSTLVS